ncbi:GIY-YIG nuclease family protein [Salipiger abyssi]|uniref:GIY-YIG nuclease family protein n=1 Tax=Salipiger abyssi TaxID=1250539 RepID=UPI0009774438
MFVNFPFGKPEDQPLTNFHPSASLKIFGVTPRDPGYVYLCEDRGRYKIGRSRNPWKRLREAFTWSPSIQILAQKPFWNHCEVEDALHTGLAAFWSVREWFDFQADPFCECFVEGFCAFDNQDINKNSIDFIYFMNGNGMSEFTLERSRTRISKAAFLKNPYK